MQQLTVSHQGERNLAGLSFTEAIGMICALMISSRFGARCARVFVRQLAFYFGSFPIKLSGPDRMEIAANVNAATTKGEQTIVITTRTRFNCRRRASLTLTNCLTSTATTRTAPAAAVNHPL